MARPSASWTSFRDIDVDSDRGRQIQSIITTANFAHLSTIALLRRQVPDVQCSISEKFTSGREHVVFELAFSDGVLWIARIPIHAKDDNSMLSEAATMRLVRERTEIPVAQVFEVQHTSNQPFGHPYMLMECLPGSHLTDRLSRAIPAEQQSKVAQQFAKVLYELSRVTFPRIGRWNGAIIEMDPQHHPGLSDSSLDYYYNQRQCENRQVLARHDDKDWVTACWLLKIASTYFLLEDKVHGPFPLCHLDLHYGNLLFDAEYNLVGVVDWSSAQAAPFEQLALSFELITAPSGSAEDTQTILNFRRLVIDAIKDLEGENPDLSTYVASSRFEVAFRATVYPPGFALEAAHLVAKHLYGNIVSWEQLREIHGSMLLA